MFSRKKKDESEFTKLRQRQLDDLLKFNPTCTLHPSKDNTTTIYQLIISTTYGPLSIHIILPSTFPERSPSIRVLSRVTHHWLDKDMFVTGHPQLGTRWGPHDSLGRVVREIHTEFSRNPPKPQTLFGGPATSFTPASPMGPSSISPSTSLNSLSSSSLSLTPSVASSSTSSSSSSSSSYSTRAHTRSPDVPQSFDFLDTMSIAQLEELAIDNDAIQEIVENMASVKSMNTVRDDLYQGVEDLANKNIAKKAEYEAMVTQLQTLQTQVDQNQAVFQQLVQRQQAALNNYYLRTIISLLDEAIQQSEQTSDILRERYEHKDDGLTHTTFVDEYLSTRRLYHQRSAKRERLQEVYGRG